MFSEGNEFSISTRSETLCRDIIQRHTHNPDKANQDDERVGLLLSPQQLISSLIYVIISSFFFFFLFIRSLFGNDAAAGGAGEREKKVDIYRQYCPFDTINYNYYISKDHLLPWPRIIIPAIVCPQIVAQQQSVYRVAKKNCKATARQEKGITALKGNCPARRTKGGKILTSDHFLNIAGES